MKKVLRRASDSDLDLLKQNKAREKEAVIRSRAISRQLKLDMKVSRWKFRPMAVKQLFIISLMTAWISENS